MWPSRYISLILLPLDAIAVWAVFNFIGRIRGVVREDHWVILPLLLPFGLVVLALYLIDGYRSRTDMLSLTYASEHLIALLISFLATLLLTFALIPKGHLLQQSRSVVALSFLALTPVTLFYRRRSSTARTRDRRMRPVVFVEDNGSRRTFAEECAKMNLTQSVLYTRCAAASGLPPVDPSGNTLRDETSTESAEQVLGRIEEGTLKVEALVLPESGAKFTPEVSKKLVRLCFVGVPTYTVELFHQVYWRKIPLSHLDQSWLFQEGFQLAREPVFGAAKRVADIMLAFLGLILAAPVLALAALAIWLDDRGPVFFSQTRIGKNGAPFRIAKLRTMRVTKGSEGPGDRYTRPGDGRITRVGGFLRVSRLDELPQLWNVLRGDMSLIGPRAEWDELVRDYEQKIPCYHFRHLVRPGITGWAQVNYPYGANVEDTRRKLEYDLYYIRHFSLLMDASIILKTIHTMLFGKGR